MKSILTRSFKYYEVSGNSFFATAELDLNNRIYRFWKDFWIAVLKNNGTSHEPDPDDYVRQDYIGAIEHGDEFVALHAHSFFDLRHLAPRDHSYFKRYYSLDFIERLTKEGNPRVMSMELYSVRPEWRTSRVGVSLASVMIALGLRLARECGAHAAIGIARKDVGMDKLVFEQGAVPFGETVDIHNTPCTPIVFRSEAMREHPDPNVRLLTKQFWKNRINGSTWSEGGAKWSSRKSA